MGDNIYSSIVTNASFMES